MPKNRAGMDTRENLLATGAALLVIDLQRGLFQRPTPVYEEESLLRNIIALAAAARRAGVPVVFLRHSNKMLVPGTESWELHGAVQPHLGDVVVDKTQGDAFEGTDLDVLLKGRSVDTVYVTGLVSEGCVRATCLGALKRGYHVVLVSDAHSSFHREAAKRIRECNEKLESQVDSVVSTGEVDFAAWRQGPKGPGLAVPGCLTCGRDEHRVRTNEQ